MIKAFIAKFYEAVIIFLSAFLLLALIGLGVQTWRASTWQKYYDTLDAKYQTDLAKAEALTEKAKADALTKEKQWSDKLLKAEIQHREDIKHIIADSNSAKSAIDRLSKQIDTASSRMSTATRETIIEYTITNSELLEACTAEYRSMAEKADGHAIDVERLREVWPEDKALK